MEETRGLEGIGYHRIHAGEDGHGKTHLQLYCFSFGTIQIRIRRITRDASLSYYKTFLKIFHAAKNLGWDGLIRRQLFSYQTINVFLEISDSLKRQLSQVI